MKTLLRGLVAAVVTLSCRLLGHEWGRVTMCRSVPKPWKRWCRHCGYEDIFMQTYDEWLSEWRHRR